MNKRLKSILIITASVSGIALVAFLITTYAFGKIRVELENNDVSYTLDGTGLRHQSSTTLVWITPGKHQIVATGIQTDNYTTKTFDVGVSRGKTSLISVFLEPTQKNPDFAVAEFNPNDNASQTLIEKLPLTNALGTLTYNYEESQYYVYLENGITHEKVLKWFADNGVKIGDNDIIWESYVGA